ncbi:MAG TPA: hypothetical protein VHF86_03200 [Xanthomonadaceae bacterium]|nr:hypothetical protein [Xanthomonadaceae bacterium]
MALIKPTVEDCGFGHPAELPAGMCHRIVVDIDAEDLPSRQVRLRAVANASD